MSEDYEVGDVVSRGDLGVQIVHADADWIAGVLVRRVDGAWVRGDPPVGYTALRAEWPACLDNLAALK